MTMIQVIEVSADREELCLPCGHYRQAMRAFLGAGVGLVSNLRWLHGMMTSPSPEDFFAHDSSELVQERKSWGGLNLLLTI